MSQHPSLRIDSVGSKHRNVLKRYERVKKMQADSQWGERTSAFNLPKLKSLKVKIKKTKEVTTEGGVAVGAEAAALASKTSKEQEQPRA